MFFPSTLTVLYFYFYYVMSEVSSQQVLQLYLAGNAHILNINLLCKHIVEDHCGPPTSWDVSLEMRVRKHAGEEVAVVQLDKICICHHRKIYKYKKNT